MYWSGASYFVEYSLLAFFFISVCSAGIAIEYSCFYLLDQYPYNYQKAQSLCQSFGGHLAYIESSRTFSVIKNYILNHRERNYGKENNFEVLVWLGAEYKVTH